MLFGAALAGNLLNGRDRDRPGPEPGPQTEAGLIRGFLPADRPEPARGSLVRLPAVRAAAALETLSDTLRGGESISELVARTGLSPAESGVLLAVLSEHADLRRLLPGLVVSHRRSVANGSVRRMSVQLDLDRMIVLRPGAAEMWSGGLEEVPVVADTAVLTGEVSTSLYQALLVGGGARLPVSEREQVVDALADGVFAWVIDFSRDLRPGDRFRVLYERRVRPDGSARSGRVLAAEFSVDGRHYHAYHFATDGGVEDYFDRQGGSLRRAFLRAPLRYRRISSAYTDSRMHPVLGRSRPHHGVDYAARMGTPIRAAGDGVVLRADWNGGYGRVVYLRHPRGYQTRYAHLSRFAEGIRTGVRVKQGEVIGYVGSSGLSTGPHLHYEFRLHGRPVDPKSVRGIQGDPVPESHRAGFDRVVSSRVAALDNVSRPVFLAGAGAVEKNQSVGD